MQIRGILFDWGGTLAHVDGQTDALLRGAAEALRRLAGQADPSLVQSMLAAAVEAEKAASNHPEYREVDLAELLHDWAGAHGLAWADGQLDAALATICGHWVGAALTPVHGVRETLEALRAMGMTIGLVSNCFIPPSYCHDELRQQGIAHLFDCTVFSSGVGYRKPSRHIYRQALRELAAAGGPADVGQILFVGDSPAYDVMAPAALGMKTALVSSHTGLWPAEDYERAQPDLRIDSVAELPALLADLS
ncbi:MAG TPA: HAD family hydrolase [Phycisphaerae bacterium]|nr:HAD family hydrolase [Phycisphaerae bacterium]HOJ73500.1 HAD family hydrolase [Phycisphaerae bacterium]HOM51692.1 HAD family hydrolase [Phycisphaerae bacterium]HON66150.1 HAD family hydrolase [Phycisphaerae bacterium]HOQ86289.1 HAD family hydrolase [Phycisphaerae bacterium]